MNHDNNLLAGRQWIVLSDPLISLSYKLLPLGYDNDPFHDQPFRTDHRPPIPHDSGYARLCYAHWSDYMLGLAGVVAILRMLFTTDGAHGLARALYTFGLVCTLRSTTIVLTVLPIPSDACRPPLLPNPDLWTDLWQVFAFEKSACEAGCFFSGHTTGFTCCVLLMLQYGQLPSKWFRWSYLIWAIIGVAYLSLCRIHYTIDIIFGVLITCTTWYFYHLSLKYPLIFTPFVQRLERLLK
jgi:membrane-associated phospholipid phosphatase